MGNIFGIIFVRPLGLILMGLYSVIQNYGLAVIAFTIVVKLILLPFMYHQKKNMKKMSAVQAQAAVIQQRYAKNPQKAQEEVQKLYAAENVSPMGGCLVSFITLPIMMALYYAVRKPLTYMMGLSDDTIQSIASALGTNFDSSSVNGQIELAKNIAEHWDKVSSFASQGLVKIDFNFFGLDLSGVPHWNVLNALWMIPVLSGITALISSLVMRKLQTVQNPAMANQNSQMASTMNTMYIIMPLMSLWIAFSLPASMGLYWIVNNIFTALQEIALTPILVKRNNSQDVKDAEKRAEAAKRELQEMKERADAQRAVAAGEVERRGDANTQNRSKKKIQQEEKRAAELKAKNQQQKKKKR